jgi:1,4-alpha-glucan branching enzyme
MVMVFDRAGVVFIFNFHATNSYPDYRVGVPSTGKYPCITPLMLACRLLDV